MFRFLRRVFIILILFIIVFFIFRLVKPEATSRFVDRVKSIPTTIGSRFHREKKSKIIINGDTTSTSSNFEIKNDDNTSDDGIDLPTLNENYDKSNENNNNNNENINNNTNNQNNGEMSDTSRLDELNKELDKILASGNNESVGEKTEIVSDGDLGDIISGMINDNDLEIIEITGNNQNTEFVVIDVEQPYEPETQNSSNNQNNSQTTNTTQQTTNTTQQTTNNNQTTTPKRTNNTSTKQKRGDCGSGLTVQDCEDLVNIFSNLNFD